MTIEEVAEMIKETGLPTRYEQYPNKQVPPLPYTVYYFPNSNNFGADDETYIKITALNIELYTATKSPKDEIRVEQVLRNHGIYWNKTEAFIESEHMYETLYEMEIIING